MQGLEKAAAGKGDEARQEIIKIFDKVAGLCDDWLAANGDTPTSNAEPDTSDVKLDGVRSLGGQAVFPMIAQAFDSAKNMYESESKLFNNTRLALREHHLRFDKDPNDPGYFSVAKQNQMMNVMKSKVMGYVSAKLIFCSHTDMCLGKLMKSFEKPT